MFLAPIYGGLPGGGATSRPLRDLCPQAPNLGQTVGEEEEQVGRGDDVVLVRRRVAKDEGRY